MAYTMEIDHLSATIEVEVYPSDDRANDYPDGVVHVALKRKPHGEYTAKFYLSLNELDSFMRMLDAARERVAGYRQN